MDKQQLLGELQLGNYVKHKTPDGEWKVEERGIIQWTADCWYDLGECILDADDIYPIELNDEWVKDFGCTAYGNTVHFPSDIKSGLWQFTLNKYAVDYVLLVNLSHTYMTIKYVHQFQNLYTLLSNGKKLELKNKSI